MVTILTTLFREPTTLLKVPMNPQVGLRERRVLRAQMDFGFRVVFAVSWVGFGQGRVGLRNRGVGLFLPAS